MKRLIYEEMLAWRKQENNKKALFVTGARQIGKTYLIRQLGETYEHFVEINFINEKEALKIFNGNLDTSTIIMNLTAYLKQSLVPGKTLIFFDEIQECPEAQTALKFLVEDGRFDYAASGSLLGVRYKKVRSYPVGFLHVITMMPMNFQEFCIANGVQEKTFTLLETCFQKHTIVPEVVHEQLLKLFRLFVIVGGMPEVVKTFVETSDLTRVLQTQEDILALYRKDISQYAGRDQVKITRIFDQIPLQLDEKNRRFKLSALQKNARSRDYEEAFLWLRDAGVALPCYNVRELKAPLRLNDQATLFKLFLNDSGLLCASSLENVQFAILQGDLSVNMGSILENVFADELQKNGFSLHYYNKQKIGELDFVIQKGHQVIPLEIKSGKDYKRHAAMGHALEVKEWSLKQGIVFCQGNLEEAGSILYLPWYMIMFLKQDRMPDSYIVDLDLSAL